MSENIDTSGLDLSSIQIEDLQKLLQKVGVVSDFNFSSLDEDDSNLSEAEQKIKELLLKLRDMFGQAEFIRSLISQVEGFKKIKDNTGEEEPEERKFLYLFQSKNREEFNERSKKLTIVEVENAKIYILQNNDLKNTFLGLREYEKVENNKKIKGWYCSTDSNARNILTNTTKVEQEKKLEKMNIKNYLQERLNGNVNLIELLSNKIQENLNSFPCSFDLDGIITDFNKEELADFNNTINTEKIEPFNNSEIQKLTNDVVNIELEKNKNSIQQLRFKIEETKISLILSEEEKKEIIDGFNAEIKNLESKQIDLGRVKTVNNTLSDSDREKLRIYKKEGKSNEEIMVILRNENENLNKALNDHEEKYKEYYDEKKKIENTNNNYYSPTLDDYSITEGGFILKGKNGVPIEGLIISEDEKNNTIGNPEATENLINFYMFFKNLNIPGVWENRENLIIAVGDININPNDGDSIKKEELRKFGNKLLTFIANMGNEGEKKKVELNSLSSVENELRKFSGANSIISDGKTFNLKGEDKFTAYLRNQGIIGGAYFKVNKFRENL